MSASLAPDDRSEMAVPAYTHPNPLIRWLFWSRLDVALRLAALSPADAVVDFASGTGVLLHSLNGYGGRIVATDLHPVPASMMLARSALSGEVLGLDAFREWAAANSRSVDCIFALDVLEHVAENELEMWSALFVRLLSPGGRLITSGATETLMYRLGRAAAGFRNTYHHRSIYDVDRTLSGLWLRDLTEFVPRRPLPRAFMIARYRPLGGHAD